MARFLFIAWLLVLLAANALGAVPQMDGSLDVMATIAGLLVLPAVVMLVALIKVPFPSTSLNWAGACMAVITTTTAIAWFSPWPRAMVEMLALNLLLFPVSAALIGVSARRSCKWERVETGRTDP